MKNKTRTLFDVSSLLVAAMMIMLAGTGCKDPKEIAREQGETIQEQAQQKMPQEPAAENAAADAQADHPDDNKKSIIHKTTAVVVDAKKALENPDIEIVDGKIKGVDPFTQAGSAYVSMASRVSTLGMQQAIQHHKVLNDRFPTYDEYMQMMKENRIEFAQLPPYKMYGYNAESGNILVLQDNRKKAELYKKAGIPLD
ncbi:hypothetical protein [Gimesia sp.]|uniref:hypothetical protein n=1 Tax=Gimesia sp. TaxID=2024833 RepID=UPI000C46E0C2|nr:hypothetical protein [Gimesia sp.]MAX38326.1 hypothetical protein [Gimesia sp.]HBL44763.1 hypothetical protein [Planctomycetaceae bacterium]|tara:strand:- start:3865 stop:4458 length:594 start_codon:yes stop_codon:yes gene_type:complete